MRWGLSLALAVTSLACSKQPEFQREPGVRDEFGNLRDGAASAPLRAPAPPPRQPSFTSSPSFNDTARGPGSAPEEPGAQGSASQAQAGDASEPPEKRDLGVELAAELTAVHTCLDLTKAAAQPEGKLTVRASAVVLGSGRVSRATITAPGQPPEALRCIEGQVTALHLKDPVPDAPVTVQAATEVVVRSAPTQLGDAAVQQPIPPAPTQPVQPGNPNVAQPQADDLARPVSDGVAGPPL